MNKFNKLIESILNTDDLTLTEAKRFDPTDFNTEKQTKKVTLVSGRFQPAHLGHKSLVDNALHPVVVLVVKGKKSSADKIKNPFPFNIQAEIIKKSFGNKVIDVIEVPFMNLVQIVSDLRDKGMEPVELMAGSDRVPQYKTFADNYKDPDKMNWDLKVKEVVRNEMSGKGVTGISATKVRNAIKDDNYDEASKMMGGLTISLFKKLRKYIK
jgi:nicotinamide mononucleotide adenylyltransferase